MAVVFPTPVWPSMESLEASHPLRQLYPEDLYPNGNYFRSPYGRTRYWILGPETGKKIVLIHGITAPSLIFKNVANTLVSSGHRVLLYDLVGRGYSQAPQIPHEVNVYIFQLAFLLQYIGWSKVNVVGFSMGGAIAAAFASSFPHLVDESVVLAASAGMMEPKQVAASQSTTPQGGPPTLQRPSNPIGPDPNALRALQTEHLPGFTTVVRSCVENGVVTNLQWAFETLGKSDKKFLVIHGTGDKIVPYSEVDKITKYIPQAELFTLEGASHYLVMEADPCEKISNKLVEFFA